MIDIEACASIGDALRAAFQTHGDRLCLIEADRDRENARLTFQELRAAVAPLAAWLQERDCRRAAILMTNQWRWHAAAAAVFAIGAELVPLDPKLAPDEHAALLAHSGADTLFVEWPFWRDRAFDGTVVVTEAPAKADVRHATRFEGARGTEAPAFVARTRDDPACIVYSSGTGGRAKGCVLTHGNYLEQLNALLKRHRFAVGDRYLSILPTNHAIDFMVGFLGPYACGATVVHLRSLRPEFIRAAFPKYRIAFMALVPMVLENLRTGLDETLAGLSWPKKKLLDLCLSIHRFCTRYEPSLPLARFLLRPIHKRFGGNLKTLFVGGAFTDPATLRRFYEFGIQVANGYGLTEAGTVVTLNDLRDYKPETVGKPLPGTEVCILEPNADGIGEVAVAGPTVMARYHDAPWLSQKTIVNGWLMTGDLGRLEPTGHLVLLGRRKNMIVTAGGKNVYPEDIEHAFDGLPVRELCVFAAHYLWSDKRTEELVLLVHANDDEFVADLRTRNLKLPNFKRVAGYVLWNKAFPRTASLKIKRPALAREVQEAGPDGVVAL